MSADDPQNGSGFTRREMQLIFERAGRSEGQRETDRRFTLAELQEIGAQAGLDMSEIQRAAASVRDVPIAHRLLGAPTRFHGTRVVNHPLNEDKLGDVIAVARAATGLHGDLRWVPVGIEWRAHPALGSIILQFTRKPGATRIDLLVAREDAAALSAIAGFGLGATLGLVAGGLVGIGLHAGPWASLSAMGITTVIGAYLSARLLWKWAARRAAAIAESLLQTVSTAADRELANMPE